MKGSVCVTIIFSKEIILTANTTFSQNVEKLSEKKYWLKLVCT